MKMKHHGGRILFAGILAGLMLAGGCVSVDLGKLMSKELQEIVVDEGGGGRDKVLLVDVSGIIMEGGGGFFADASCSPEYIKSVLSRAEADDRVKAVVLRIDSPGGTVGASELIAREVAQFRKRTGLPVYAQINGLGCSGGYYIAAACEKIHIQPSGITGSIGVIAVFPKYRKLADKVGFEEVVIKSGALKDIGNGMREMTDEERAVLQGLIDSNYDGFLAWILKNRPQVGDREALKKAADGRIYTAAQALELKLVDQTCFLDETLLAARTAANAEEAKVVTYGYSESPDANIYSSAAAESPVKLGVNLPGLTSPHSGFYYLWMPGH